MDEQIAGQVEDSVKTDIGLQITGVEQVNGEHGCYAAEANGQPRDTEVAKALIEELRRLVRGICVTDFNPSLDTIAADFESAALAFERDAAAILEVATAAFAPLVAALETEGESLYFQLLQHGRVAETIPLELHGQTLGELTLLVDSDQGLSMTLSGDLTGASGSSARTVRVDNLMLSSDVRLIDLVNRSTGQTAFTFRVSGGLSDGSTSMNISSGELSVAFAAASAADSEPEVGSLQMDLAIQLSAAGASFTGNAVLQLIKPDADKAASPLYGDLPLTLQRASMEGNFTTSSGAALEAGISLDLSEADGFCLPALLNQHRLVQVSIQDALPENALAALQSQALLAGADSFWSLDYGCHVDDGGLSCAFVRTASENGGFFGDDDYPFLSDVFDPVAALRAEFGRLETSVEEARVCVDSEGNNVLLGAVKLGPLQETDDYFLKARLNAHVGLSDIHGLPPFSIAAEIDRNRLKGADATLLVSWNSEQYTFTLEQLELDGGIGKLIMTNPQGVSLTLADLAEDGTEVTGALYVGSQLVADVCSLESGAIWIRYFDDTSESL